MADRHRQHGRWVWSAVATGIAVLAVTTGTAQTGDEPAPMFRASDLLSPSVLSGPHYTVADPVETEGYLHEFSLTSDFGPFTAVGRSQLAARINDIRALAALDDVSKSEVFLKAAGGAVVNVGKGAASAAVDPVGTAKGLGGGVKRFGVNLGRATKRAVTTDGGAPSGESAPEGAANMVLGVSSAMRRWARKVGADPYTTNLVLRGALRDIARVDAAGAIATKIVVPIPMIVGTAATVGDLVWSMDPEALRKLNEQRVRTLGVADSTASAFFRNGWFTLTLQTRLVAALDAVGRPGCGDYVVTAAAADNEQEVLFFVESAEMLQSLHARSPVDRLMADSRALVAAAGDRTVALLPLDYVHSTRAAMDHLAEIGTRARQELGARRLELQLTGRASARARQDAGALGWAITESVPAR